MTDTLKIALAQLNPTVGDIVGNTELIRGARAQAASAGADLVVTSELVICGYPPEDLVIRPIVQETIKSEITALAADTADGGPAVLAHARRRLLRVEGLVVDVRDARRGAWSGSGRRRRAGPAGD